MGASQWSRRQRSCVHPLSLQEGSATGTPSLRCIEWPLVSFHPDPSVQLPCLIKILFKPQAHTLVGQIKGKTTSQLTVQQPQCAAHPSP